MIRSWLHLSALHRYPKHNVQPYIPAKKPQPNYGLFSD